MVETIISVKDLTKDYGYGRGIFDVNLDITKGQVFGYVGTNGSGKTTTIRHMMGFVKADKGNVTIEDMDSWKDSTRIMKYVSYVPGEIAFPALATGTDFLKLQAEYLGIKDFTYMNHVISMLQLDPTAPLKRMSKGMKQKTAIVAALMGDKDILILDEPTTGLDPLMRDSFLELIREEKAKGRTIFMSSHIFEEIENVCDKVAMIRDGHIFDTVDLWNLRHMKTKKFEVSFNSPKDLKEFTEKWNAVTEVSDEDLTAKTEFPVDDIKQFFYVLKGCSVSNLKEEQLTLSQYFLDRYKEGNR